MPERGDPIRLAELGRSFEGELPLSVFDRLSGDLASTRGNAAYKVRFGTDERGHGFAEGRVRTELPLMCQRCLKPYSMAVERRWRIVLMDDPAEEELLDEGEDAFLVTDRGMKLSDLVEDELILAMPVVPMHPGGACDAPAPGEADSPPEAVEDDATQKPFTGLSRLKRGDS